MLQTDSSLDFVVKNLLYCYLHNISLTSVNLPLMAAAAAIIGLIRWVLPPTPCLPSKFLFEVLSHLSPGESTSGFIPRHMLQPDSRHSNPAFLKILSSPICSACAFTIWEPGTTIALTFGATVLPLITIEASRRSSSLELVQDPMNTLSTVMSVIGSPGFKSI